MPAPMLISTPDLLRRVQPRALNRWTSRSYGATTPERLNSIIKQVEAGQLEEWTDFAHYMLRTDPHLHAVYVSRQYAVAGADWEITAGRGDPQIAEAAAEFCREVLAETEELERIFSDLMHGVGLGWAAFEHSWRRKSGAWVSTPQWIHPRECQFEPDWTLAVRDSGTNELVRVADMPGKFIVHIPRPVSDSPNVSGELLVIAWDWLFKRWARKFQLGALEKFANPFVYGEVQPNTDDIVRSNLLTSLEKLSSDQVAIFEAGTGVKIAEVTKMPGEAWQTAIDNLNNEITKSLLGSTLNTEISSTGGNRAAAESQADNTILPRARSDAKRLAGTIERDWLRPLLAYNAHLFGGQVPPVPHFEFKLTQDEKPEVDELIVKTNGVTMDELRASRGLEAWGPDKGGDRLVMLPEVMQQPVGGTDPGLPLFSKTPRKSSRSTAAKTTQTSLPFPTTPIDRALSALLVDRVSSPSGTRSKR